MRWGRGVTETAGREERVEVEDEGRLEVRGGEETGGLLEVTTVAVEKTGVGV